MAIVTTVVTGPLRLLRQHRSNSIIGHGTFLIMRKGSYAELCLCTMARDLTTAPVQQEMDELHKTIEEGAEFSCFEAVSAAIADWEKRNHVQLYVRHSRSVEAGTTNGMMLHCCTSM